jgi:hypothetical protein
VAKYSKQLHIRKNGVIQNIDLYTTLSDINGKALILRDGNNVVYAKLDTVGAANSTNLRARINSTVYQVSSTASVPYGIAAWAAGSYTFVVPSGVSRIRCICVGGGGTGGWDTWGGPTGTASRIGSNFTSTGGAGGYPNTAYSSNPPNGTCTAGAGVISWNYLPTGAVTQSPNRNNGANGYTGYPGYPTAGPGNDSIQGSPGVGWGSGGAGCGNSWETGGAAGGAAGNILINVTPGQSIPITVGTNYKQDWPGEGATGLVVIEWGQGI